jgi:hypothetical protein
VIPSLNRGQWLSFPALFNRLGTGLIIGSTNISSSVLYVFFHWSMDVKSPFFYFPTIIFFFDFLTTPSNLLYVSTTCLNQVYFILKAWNFSMTVTFLDESTKGTARW